jgi:hypothetical protein
MRGLTREIAMQATWPDRFVYVCSAGRAGVVNALPIAHAGVGRIAAVYILCGAANEDDTAGSSASEALGPARHLSGLLLGWDCALPVQNRYGDPDQFQPWIEHLKDIGRRHPDLPLVFNVTGGRKQMSIGGILGWQATRRDGSLLLSVPGAALRVETFGESLGEVRTLPVRQELSLADRLVVQGRSEHDPERRQLRQADYERAEDAIERFASFVLPKVASVAPVLNRAVRELLPPTGSRGTFTPGPLPIKGKQSWACQAARDALRAIVGIAGLERREVSGAEEFHATTEAGARLVQSGWLEAVLYLRLKRRFSGRSDIGVAANVEIDLPAPETKAGKATANEIDVVVTHGSRLYLIEAKAGVGDSAAKSLEQVARLRRDLIGQYDRVILVVPRHTQQDLQHSSGGLISRARDAGTDLMLGRAAVDNTVDLIEWLCRPGPTA